MEHAHDRYAVLRRHVEDQDTVWHEMSINAITPIRSASCLSLPTSGFLRRSVLGPRRRVCGCSVYPKCRPNAANIGSARARRRQGVSSRRLLCRTAAGAGTSSCRSLSARRARFAGAERNPLDTVGCTWRALADRIDCSVTDRCSCSRPARIAVLRRGRRASVKIRPVVRSLPPLPPLVPACGLGESETRLD